MSWQAVVKVETPPRATPSGGPGPATAVSFRPNECVCTWSWGLQPATALIDWTSASVQPFILPQSALTITLGPYTFFGICVNAVPVIGTDGFSVMQEFQDSRYFLQSDVAYCAFNLKRHRIINGIYQRVYAHILPYDFNTFRETYTTTPYTAAQVLDFLFDAPTTETPWSRVYDPSMAAPVFDLDWTSGRKLGQAVVEVSEKLGLTFTLMGGRYSLVWAVKGVGTRPDFPAGASHKRSGVSLSGMASRVRLLGDRNLYQVLNIDLVPDWVSGWQGFWNFNEFVSDIYQNEATEAPFGDIPAGTSYTSIDAGNENNAGYLLARARAQVITVGQYAALRDARDNQGGLFRDYRKYGNRSRLNLPVAVYLSQVLFRAYRFPAQFWFENVAGQAVGLTSMSLSDSSLVQVTHDPVSGKMRWDQLLPSQPNGYAIVRGFQVAQDAFKSLHPEYFNFNDWLGTQQIWQAASFHIDDSGEGDQFILFDEPVISTADLVGMDPTGNYPVLKAGATITAPPVRVAVTFAAERFSWVAGEGGKDDVENVSGLGGQYVVGPVAGTTEGGIAVTELPYADGQTASQKAVQLASPLLNRQYWLESGGWSYPGFTGLSLTGALDRLTARMSTGGGFSEEVDFATERSRNVSLVAVPHQGGVVYVPHLQTEPERAFERRQQLSPLVAGQAELRDEANQLRAEAAWSIKHPQQMRQLMQMFHLLMGLDAPPEALLLTDPLDAYGPVMAGSPIFRDADANNGWFPGSGQTVATPVFLGVTVLDGEDGAGPVQVTRTGNGGVIFARVQGPVAVNDGVSIQVDGSGNPLANDRLAKAASGQQAVGNALEAIGDTSVKLIQVSVLGASGAGGGNATAMQIQAINDDYYTCYPWNGTTWDSTNPTKVAKPFKLRGSIRSEVLGGTTFSYTYGTGSTTRNAGWGGGAGSEGQVVDPYYLSGDIIMAIQSTYTGVTGATWIDINVDARAWLKAY